MASGNDMKGAMETYHGFTTMLKVGMIGVALVAILVILLIT